MDAILFLEPPFPSTGLCRTTPHSPIQQISSPSSLKPWPASIPIHSAIFSQSSSESPTGIEDHYNVSRGTIAGFLFIFEEEFLFMSSIGWMKLRSLEFDRCERLCLGLPCEYLINTGAASSFPNSRRRFYPLIGRRGGEFAIAETH